MNDGLVRAVGLMSGTSMDGVDAALIETDGERLGRTGPALTHAYDDVMRTRLRRALEAARTLEDRHARPGHLAEAEGALDRCHAEAVAELLRQAELAAGDVRVVGYHGHTVLHLPQAGLTVQLGDGAALARLTGIDVVCDFRARDMAEGGEGAPLAPLYHRALASSLGLDGPLAFLNLGGVANLTFIDADGALIAFDTGPGNALLDDWAQATTGAAMDEDGALAARGRVDKARLTALLADPYFARPWSKSLDRDAFGLAPLDGLSPPDGAATLAAFTAAAVALAAEKLPAPPKRWIVCGGGRRN